MRYLGAFTVALTLSCVTAAAENADDSTLNPQDVAQKMADQLNGKV